MMILPGIDSSGAHLRRCVAENTELVSDFTTLMMAMTILRAGQRGVILLTFTA
jgi:hypothetical protein